jgi:hypothetical protein
MAPAGTDKTALEKIGEMQIGRDIGGDSAEVPTLQLSDQESQILELYDRLEEITQGISLLQAQDSISLGKHSSTMYVSCLTVLTLNREIRGRR